MQKLIHDLQSRKIFLDSAHRNLSINRKALPVKPKDRWEVAHGLAFISFYLFFAKTFVFVVIVDI